MKIKALAMVFAALMLFTTVVSASSTVKTIEVNDSSLNIMINLSSFDEEVFVYNDMLYAPLIKTIEAMGGEHTINEKNNTLNISSAPLNSYELIAVDGSTLSDDVKLACNTMIGDMAMLITYSSCMPKFYVFVENIFQIKELADLNLYKEAQISFDECITLLLELKSQADETEKAYIDSISRYSGTMYDAYRKIIQAALYESANAMSNLARYVNDKQIDKENNSIKNALEKECNTILNLQAMVEHIDTRIPLSYLYAYSNNKNGIQELSDIIMDDLKKDFVGLNWYDEYKKLIDGFDFPFDDKSKVPSIIIFENDLNNFIENTVSNKDDIDDNVAYINTTEPINTATAFTNLPKENMYTDGAYRVGIDMPSGEYIIIPNMLKSTYFSVKNKNNDILANGYSDSSYYITVENGQYLMIDDGFAIPANKYNVAVYDYSMIYPGMYKVGTDIPVGEYKFTTNEDNGYYCVYDNSTTERKIISNDFFGKASYVNVKCGDYLLVDCIAHYNDPNS